jgi:glutathione S-transferase
MALKLFLHPLSSYCHKALIAFYENDVAFEPVIVDAANAAEFKKLWPLGKFPVLQDTARERLIPESSIIIEYLACHYPGRSVLIPADPDQAREVRLRDRFFDNYLHAPMQKYPADRMRPPEMRDAFGIDAARALYRTALDMVDADMRGRTWALGESFTMADCAAAPALYYGARFYGPFGRSHPHAMSYLDRLMARPSYARALEEARPYLHFLPD